MSASSVTLDANILVYALDTRLVDKHHAAIDLVAAAAGNRCKLGLQAIGEFYVASTGKLKLPHDAAGTHARNLLATFETFPHTQRAIVEAAEQARLGRYYFWDAVLLCSAEDAGCAIMLSEDMHDGAKLGNITVRNPFGAKGLTVAAKEVLGL